MATHVRHPILIGQTRPNAWTFSLLYLLESIARAALVTVLPLTAYALFRDKEAVSLAYTAVSLVSLSVSFTIPILVRRLSRRWTYTLGCVLLALFALLLSFALKPALLLGMLCRTTGAAMLNVTLALYIMDTIGKRELTRSEPLRLAVATLAWGIVPFLGVWLMEHVGLWAPCLLSGGAAAALVALFWTLRLREGGPIRAAQAGPGAARPHPLRAIRRFAAQPRLRLAWAIAFARSSFWVTFFVYIPILMVEGGPGESAGGLAVAAGNLMLFNNVFSRRLAERLTLRLVLGGAFLGASLLVLLVAGLSLDHPAAAGAVMVGAAFFVAMIDGLGPVPFLRAVRAHERSEMTAVYRTYLDASELLPQIAYFLLFLAFGFPGAFAALALLLAAMGALTLRHLPRGM